MLKKISDKIKSETPITQISPCSGSTFQDGKNCFYFAVKISLGDVINDDKILNLLSINPKKDVINFTLWSDDNNELKAGSILFWSINMDSFREDSNYMSWKKEVILVADDDYISALNEIVKTIVDSVKKADQLFNDENLLELKKIMSEKVEQFRLFEESYHEFQQKYLQERATYKQSFDELKRKYSELFKKKLRMINDF
jgi:hypothetical protein